MPGPPFLKVHRALVGHDLGLHLVVRHRKESDTEVPAVGNACRSLAEGKAGAQKVGAGDVGAEIQIPESEPWPPDSVSVQLDADPLCLADAAPPAHLVVRPGEGVHDRVEVRCDAQAAEPHVVARVHHRCDLSGGTPGPVGKRFAQVVTQAAKKTGAADAAREYGNFHGANASPTG